MRLFYALIIPRQVKEELFNIISKFQSYIPTSVKWVEEENLHLTFKFIGEVEASQYSDLEERFSLVMQKCRQQKFVLHDIELFPQEGPRLIWVSLKSQTNQFSKASSYFSKILQEGGFKVENKAFTPHITLGRVKRNLIKPDIDIIEQEEISKIEFTIDRIALFSSTLTKKGPQYSILQMYNLR